MMTWFFRAIPPSAMTLLTGIPCSVKHSIMARAPKAVAAIRAAEQHRRVSSQVKVGDHPFQALVGIRAVRRPLPNQSSTTGRCSSDGLLAQASVSAGSNCFWLALICSRNAGCC